MIGTKSIVEVARLSGLQERTGRLIKIGSLEISLFKTSLGTVRALQNKSPHPKGGTLVDGLVSGEFVFCPLYDWKISLIDGKVQAPDSGMVKVYEVETLDDKIFILL
ncbi:nitrite reductase small subunit NirD [Cytobacillus suaedae]|nr:nitrite reductase small subunit NirD [Cytobacillus suaedae]